MADHVRSFESCIKETDATTITTSGHGTTRLSHSAAKGLVIYVGLATYTANTGNKIILPKGRRRLFFIICIKVLELEAIVMIGWPRGLIQVGNYECLNSQMYPGSALNDSPYDKMFVMSFLRP